MLDLSTQIRNFSSVVHVQLTYASNVGLEVERDTDSRVDVLSVLADQLDVGNVCSQVFAVV
jgi:hypothetical protein